MNTVLTLALSLQSNQKSGDSLEGFDERSLSIPISNTTERTKAQSAKESFRQRNCTLLFAYA